MLEKQGNTYTLARTGHCMKGSLPASQRTSPYSKINDLTGGTLLVLATVFWITAFVGIFESITNVADLLLLIPFAYLGLTVFGKKRQQTTGS